MSSAAAQKASSKTPILVWAVMVWIFFEFARPSMTFKLPLLISITLFLSWLAERRKRWDPQIVCMFVLLAHIWLGMLYAENYFSTYSRGYDTTIILLTVSIPMAHVMKTLPQVDLVLRGLLVVMTWVAIYAATHSGFGPAGAFGGQDENYVSLFMCVAIPIAYFGIFLPGSMMRRLFLIGSAGVCTIAVIVGFSRGGFLGMVGVGFYCWLQSPRKWLALGILGVIGVVVSLVASEVYWQEMSTVTDTGESTANLRLELWKIAFREFLAYPITGVGAGNFIWQAGRFQSDEQFAAFGRSLGGGTLSHSLYFDVLSELGAIGVTLFATVVYKNLSDLRTVIRLGDRHRVGLLKGDPGADEQLARAYYHARALSASLVGFLICSLFLSSFYYSIFWLLTAFSVSLRALSVERVRALARRPKSSPSPSPAQPPPEPPPTVAPPPPLSSLLR